VGSTGDRHFGKLANGRCGLGDFLAKKPKQIGLYEGMTAGVTALALAEPTRPLAGAFSTSVRWSDGLRGAGGRPQLSCTCAGDGTDTPGVDGALANRVAGTTTEGVRVAAQSLCGEFWHVGGDGALPL